MKEWGGGGHTLPLANKARVNDPRVSIVYVHVKYMLKSPPQTKKNLIMMWNFVLSIDTTLRLFQYAHYLYFMYSYVVVRYLKVGVVP